MKKKEFSSFLPLIDLDASGKSPNAFLDGTVTSFGDYEECIFNVPDGKFCMVKDFIQGPRIDDWKVVKNRLPIDEPKKINLKDVVIFKDSQMAYGLCLPASCANNDFVELSKIGQYQQFVDCPNN